MTQNSHQIYRELVNLNFMQFQRSTTQIKKRPFSKEPFHRTLLTFCRVCQRSHFINKRQFFFLLSSELNLLKIYPIHVVTTTSANRSKQGPNKLPLPAGTDKGWRPFCVCERVNVLPLETLTYNMFALFPPHHQHFIHS